MTKYGMEERSTMKKKMNFYQYFSTNFNKQQEIGMDHFFGGKYFGLNSLFRSPPSSFLPRFLVLNNKNPLFFLFGCLLISSIFFIWPWRSRFSRSNSQWVRSVGEKYIVGLFHLTISIKYCNFTFRWSFWFIFISTLTLFIIVFVRNFNDTT